MAFEYLVPQSLTDTGGLLTSSAIADIDETVDALDSVYNTTATNDQTSITAASWALTNISSFAEVVSVTFRVNAAVLNISNDTCTYRFRLNVGGSTYDINFSDTDSAYSTKTIAVGTFTEAQYNAATVELVQTAHSKSSGPDGYLLSIDAFDLSIEFTDDVNVISDHDTLTFTEYTSVIAITDTRQQLVSNLDTLSLAEYTTSVNDKTEIASTYDILVLTGYDSVAEINVNVVSNYETLNLAVYNTFLNVKKEVTSNVDTLTFTEYVSNAKLTHNIVSTNDILTLNNYNTLLNVKKELISNSDALSVAGFNGVITSTRALRSNLDQLTFTTYKSETRLVIPGIFYVDKAITFNGTWIIKET